MFLLLPLIFSGAVMASEVVLSPGGQVLIRAVQDVQVSCLGDQVDLPRCIVYNRKPTESNSATYYVVAGTNNLREYAPGLDEALELVKKFRSSGLCQ